jgi:hypothetical protein
MKPLALFGPPVIFACGAWFIFSNPYSQYTSLYIYGLAIAIMAYLAVLMRGRLRDSAFFLSAILFGLFVIESFSVARESQPVDTRSEGYSVSQTILGWGPGHAGIFHQKKADSKTSQTIFEVDYTIDQHLLRKTLSADHGPAIAFFGDSMTFGTGLNDADTLPQAFADALRRRVRVLNFGFPGYGPQQFARALETSMYDNLLHENTRYVVYETSAWHAERSSCRAGFMLRAPRYELNAGEASYQGTCYGRLSTLVKELFANTAAYRVFIDPVQGVSKADMDLYIGVIAKAARLAEERYGAKTLVVYLPAGEAYLRHSGYSEAEVIAKLRQTGVDVMEAHLDEKTFAGSPLWIPGDGHPTALANKLRADMLKDYLLAAAPELAQDISLAR